MGKGISLSDLPEPYRRQAEQTLIQEMQRRASIQSSDKAENRKVAVKKGKTDKPPKLRNKKVTRDGKTFDSKREADRYDDLALLEKQGVIQNLEWQKEYLLIPAQYKTVEQYGKRGTRIKDKRILLERQVTYVADFVYEKDGETVVEDSKGYRNPSSAPYAKFVLKRKLMLWIHGIRITEV